VQFNLQSRLEAARAERRRQTQTLPADPAPVETATPDTSLSVIDLRTIRSMREAAGRPAPDLPGPVSWNGTARSSVALVLQRQEARREPVTTTNPVQDPCPGCGGSVRLDVFDLVESVAHLTCLDCGLLFTARSPHS
jgi:hypothetical protein